jgi:cytochrome c-type biogenesis protein CcmE
MSDSGNMSNPPAGRTPDPSPPRRRVWGIRLRLLIGFLAVAASIGLLVANGAKKTMVYYVTVSELLSKERGRNLSGLRVTGTVVPGSITRDALELKFAMTDGAKEIPVVYRGIVPDTFSEKGEVVVEGAFLNGETFEANFLMAKCPSKYEASPDQKHPSDIPLTKSTTS